MSSVFAFIGANRDLFDYNIDWVGSNLIYRENLPWGGVDEITIPIFRDALSHGIGSYIDVSRYDSWEVKNNKEIKIERRAVILARLQTYCLVEGISFKDS